MMALIFVCAAPAQELKNVSLPSLDGAQHSPAEYKGKVVVVNFWATWCVPCQKEMPLFVDEQQRYGDKVQVIAVSLDDSRTQGKIPDFAKVTRMSFPILLASVDEMKKLGLGEALPATAFLDAEGNVVARIFGEISKSDLRRRLEWMLEKKGSEPPALIDKFAQKKHDDSGAINVVMH